MTGAGLRIVALAAAFLAAAALAFLVARILARGRATYLAPASGSSARGIAYAFGAGMLPGAKESAREHRATYLAGVAYHLGAQIGDPLPNRDERGVTDDADP